MPSHDDGERRCGERRRAKTLHGARNEQHRPIGREATHEAGPGEEGEPPEQYSPAPINVAATGRQQHEAPEKKQVAIHDPLQADRRQRQVLLHGGQRNVDDRAIHHDHESAQAGDDRGNGRGYAFAQQRGRVWYCRRHADTPSKHGGFTRRPIFMFGGYRLDSFAI
jgi:hypothetical protein